MTVSLKHTFQSAKTDSADTTIVQPSNWNEEHVLTAAAGKVLGRDTSGNGTVQELPISVTPAGDVGIGTSTPGQKLTVTGTIESTSGGFKFPDGSTQSSAAAAGVSYPQNSQSGNYTLVLADAGKHIYSTNTAPQTITIPTNASVAFPIGSVITIVNQGTTSILLSAAGVSVFPENSSIAVTSPVVPAGSTGQLVKIDTNSWEAILGVVQANLVNYVAVAGGSYTGNITGGGGGGFVTGATNFELGVITITVGSSAPAPFAGAGSPTTISGSTTVTARSTLTDRSITAIPPGLTDTYYDGASYFTCGGGGGGAGGAGGNGSGAGGVGLGGIGAVSTITGSLAYYGAGGNGGISGTSDGVAGSSGVAVISIPASEYSGTYTGTPTITRAGNNIALRYASSGTYTATVGGGIFYDASLLVIAGGGGGGNPSHGGGGAGGYIPSSQTLFRGLTYTVVVGAGGAGAPNSSTLGATGSNSTVSTVSLTALGGSGGGSQNNQTAVSGGSGGGGATNFSGFAGLGGAATQPTSASGGFGNAGGNATGSTNTGAGGGG